MTETTPAQRASLGRVAKWMRDGTAGTIRCAKAHFDVDVLLKLLGGSPTLTFPVIRVDGRAYTVQPAGSEVLISRDPGA